MPKIRTLFCIVEHFLISTLKKNNVRIFSMRWYVRQRMPNKIRIIVLYYRCYRQRMLKIRTLFRLVDINKKRSFLTSCVFWFLFSWTLEFKSFLFSICFVKFSGTAIRFLWLLLQDFALSKLSTLLRSPVQLRLELVHLLQAWCQYRINTIALCALGLYCTNTYIKSNKIELRSHLLDHVTFFLIW